MSNVQAPAPDPPKLRLLRAAKALVVFVYIVVLIDVVLLILGFFLQLFGASTDAEFTRWVYRNVERVMEPFRGMFPSQAVSDQSVLDVSLLFAMVVYSIVAIAVHALVTWLTDRIVAQRRLQHVARAGMPASGAATEPGGPAPHYPPGVPTGRRPSYP
ncbi:MAG: hypothetical protein ACRD2C_28375 [Acidimicrobiales bacterium]